MSVYVNETKEKKMKKQKLYGDGIEKYVYKVIFITLRY